MPTLAPLSNLSWTLVLKPSDGFTYRGQITLHRPTHFSSSALPQCQADESTDAQLLGTLRLANDSAGPAGEPGVQLTVQSAQSFTRLADRDHCNSPQTGPGLAFYATSPLGLGQEIHEDIAVVIPNYFDRIYPHGDVDLLKDQMIGVTYFNQGFTSGAAVSLSGPGVSADSGAAFTLAPLGEP